MNEVDDHHTFKITNCDDFMPSLNPLWLVVSVSNQQSLVSTVAVVTVYTHVD